MVEKGPCLTCQSSERVKTSVVQTAVCYSKDRWNVEEQCEPLCTAPSQQPAASVCVYAQTSQLGRSEGRGAKRCKATSDSCARSTLDLRCQYKQAFVVNTDTQFWNLPLTGMATQPSLRGLREGNKRQKGHLGTLSLEARTLSWSRGCFQRLIILLRCNTKQTKKDIYRYIYMRTNTHLIRHRS